MRRRSERHPAPQRQGGMGRDFEREESRGAHQRNDFTEINSSKNFNVSIKLNNKDNTLTNTKLPLKKMRKELSELVVDKKQEESLKDKLLE